MFISNVSLPYVDSLSKVYRISAKAKFRFRAETIIKAQSRSRSQCNVERKFRCYANSTSKRHRKNYVENSSVLKVESTSSYLRQIDDNFSTSICLSQSMKYRRTFELSNNDVEFVSIVSQLILKRQISQNFNLFSPNSPFLYPLKTSENLTVF